jgi:hypothetical protein
MQRQSLLYARDAIINSAIDRGINPQDTVGDFKGPCAIGDYFHRLLERLADPQIGEFMNCDAAKESGDWRSATVSFTTWSSASASRRILAMGRAC